MFGYKNILLISKNNLSISRCNQKKIKSTSNFIWASETLTQQLEAIKNKYGHVYRILLDDYYVYTAHIYLAESGENLRSKVQEKAQEIIPEDLSQTMWDFKEEVELRDNNQKTGRYYQILAVNKQFFSLLNYTISSLDLKIEAIEPVSQALARQLSQKQDEPFLILYRQNNYCLVACFGDIIIDVKTLGSVLTTEAVQEYQRFLEQKYGLKPEKVFVSNQQNDIEALEKSGLNLVKYQYQPEFSLYQKSNLRGNDFSVLNLDLAQSDQTQNNHTQAKLISILKKLIPILVLFLVLGWLWQNRTLIKIAPSTKKETVQTSPTPKSQTITNSSYSITILNGNGVEGAATEAEALLDEKGYKVVNLDNAKNYDYEQTLLQHKQNVDSKFLGKLDKLLKTQYDVVIEADFLKGSENSDIIIILGKQ